MAAPWFDENPCKGLLVGENCTESWEEYLGPKVESLQIVQICLFLFSSLCCAYILLKTLQQHGWDINKVSRLRLNTVTSALASSICFVIFWALGGGLKYDIDTFEGQLVIFVVGMAIGLFFQTANWLAVLYMSLMTNALESKGFMDQFNIRTVRRLAVLYPFYIVMLVIAICCFAGVIKDFRLAVRIVLALCLYPLGLACTICAYYYRKLGKLLYQAAKAGSEGRNNTSSSVYSQWRRLAFHATCLSYYAVFVGIPAFLIVFSSTLRDWNSDPDFYFGFVFCFVGFGIFCALLLFIMQFTGNFACITVKVGSSGISRRFSKPKADPPSSKQLITRVTDEESV